jgi:hypothetical protein
MTLEKEHDVKATGDLIPEHDAVLVALKNHAMLRNLKDHTSVAWRRTTCMEGEGR